MREEPTRVYRRRRRRRKKKKWPFVVISVIVLIGIALAGAVALGFNPLIDMQLRARFGADFFSDFGDLSPHSEGGDLETIINNYEPSFASLEKEALSRLDRLFTTAVEDYHSQESTGNLDRFRFTNKYIQAGRVLEKNVDGAFNDLLDEMKDELNRYGHPTTITVEIKETYDKAKSEKKRELLDRLRQATGF